MVEAQGHGREGQATINIMDMGHVPPTVEDHTRHANGATLVTIDQDPDTNIEIYDDGREMHLSGNPPGDS